MTRSAMSGEVIAFSDMFDIAIALAEELSVVLRKKITVKPLTDSKSI